MCAGQVYGNFMGYGSFNKLNSRCTDVILEAGSRCSVHHPPTPPQNPEIIHPRLHACSSTYSSTHAPPTWHLHDITTLTSSTTTHSLAHPSRSLQHVLPRPRYVAHTRSPTYNSNSTRPRLAKAPAQTEPAQTPKMSPSKLSPSDLTRSETLTLLSLSASSLAVLLNTFQGDGEPLAASLALSVLAFSVSYALITWLGPRFIAAGFSGRDMSKPSRPLLPECMGAVCAAVYLITVIVFIPFPFYKDIVAATSGGGNRDVVLHVEHVNQGRFLHRFPHNKASLSSPLLPSWFSVPHVGGRAEEQTGGRTRIVC